MNLLEANTRELKLKPKKFRRQGLVTGMLKKLSGEYIPIYLKGNEVDKFLRRNGDKSEVKVSINDLVIDTKIVEVQRNLINHNTINLDLCEIDKN